MRVSFFCLLTIYVSTVYGKLNSSTLNSSTIKAQHSASAEMMSMNILVADPKAKSMNTMKNSQGSSAMSTSLPTTDDDEMNNAMVEEGDELELLAILDNEVGEDDDEINTDAPDYDAMNYETVEEGNEENLLAELDNEILGEKKMNTEIFDNDEMNGMMEEANKNELLNNEGEYEEEMNVQVSDNDEMNDEMVEEGNGEDFLVELNDELNEEEEMNAKVPDAEAKHMNVVDPKEKAIIKKVTYEMNNVMENEESAKELLAKLDDEIGNKDEAENNEVITEIDSKPSTEILKLMKELDTDKKEGRNEGDKTN